MIRARPRLLRRLKLQLLQFRRVQSDRVNVPGFGSAQNCLVRTADTDQWLVRDNPASRRLQEWHPVGSELSKCLFPRKFSHGFSAV